jgi:hypothetical protein
MRHLAHQDRLILDALARLEELKGAGPLAEPVARRDQLGRPLDKNDRCVLALTLKAGAG